MENFQEGKDIVQFAKEGGYTSTSTKFDGINSLLRSLKAISYHILPRLLTKMIGIEIIYLQ